MKVYKFMPKKYVADFLGGRFKISTLGYFRRMEGPQWIADKHEGRAFGIFENYRFDQGHPQADEHRRRLLQAGVFVGNADDISFTNSKVIIEGAPVYVFCASLDPFEKAKKAMCEDAPADYRYDGCVEIIDLALFAKEVGGAKVPSGDNFAAHAGRYQAAKVKYEKRDLSFDSGDEMRFNPYLKHPIFEYQQEVRLIIEPRGPLLGETFFLQMTSPMPDGLMKEIVI